MVSWATASVMLSILWQMYSVISGTCTGGVGRCFVDVQHQLGRSLRTRHPRQAAAAHGCKAGGGAAPMV